MNSTFLNLEAIACPALIANGDGVISWGNARAHSFLKLDKLSGLELAEIIPPSTLRRVLTSRGVYSAIVEVGCAKSSLPAFLSVLQLPDSDADNYLLLFRSPEAVDGISGDNFATIGHHIKNSLSGVLGFSDLLGAAFSGDQESDEHLKQLRLAAFKTEVRVLAYLHFAERTCERFGITARGTEERGCDLGALVKTELRQQESSNIITTFKIEDEIIVPYTYREAELFIKTLLLFLMECATKGSITFFKNPTAVLTVTLVPKRDIHNNLAVLRGQTFPSPFSAAEEDLLPLTLKSLIETVSGTIEIETAPPLSLKFVFTGN